MKKAVEGAELPLLLRIRERCVVKGKTVFKKGQYVTVLQHKQIHLLTGSDAQGRHFNINKGIQQDVVANVLQEEMQPKTGDDVVKFIKGGHVNTIALKNCLSYGSMVLSAGE